eukprot:CAMPEP_0170347114 /NCGR_PEP_ID=MMETSP0116_2-20130129/74813_1 /TAXON_ID=400756 /ORGANISM="Durinskia baltica, Strain CSIRO CS-38" /LENGTH=75 /DNA_ID=CAMNT_0010600929 /DNA_START=183 /DNA_END=407 /DNA_ORIENTATION=+
MPSPNVRADPAGPVPGRGPLASRRVGRPRRSGSQRLGGNVPTSRPPRPMAGAAAAGAPESVWPVTFGAAATSKPM